MSRGGRRHISDALRRVLSSFILGYFNILATVNMKSTMALKGYHCINFSLHYINFDLCETRQI